MWARHVQSRDRRGPGQERWARGPSLKSSERARERAQKSRWVEPGLKSSERVGGRVGGHKGVKQRGGVERGTRAAGLGGGCGITARDLRRHYSTSGGGTETGNSRVRPPGRGSVISGCI